MRYWLTSATANFESGESILNTERDTPVLRGASSGEKRVPAMPKLATQILTPAHILTRLLVVITQ